MTCVGNVQSINFKQVMYTETRLS